MVLCSIEEAWGSDFNQNFKYNPGTSKTYQKKNNQPSKNRYRYSFHRSSEPLPNHNGSYRDKNVYDVTLDNNTPSEEEYQFENSNKNNLSLMMPHHKLNKKITDNNEHDDIIEKKKSLKKITDDFDPLYDIDNDYDQNYENFDSQSYNENSDDEFDITKLRNQYNTKKNNDQDNNSTSTNDSDDDSDNEDEFNNKDKNQSSKNITNNMASDLGKVKVNFNLSDLNQKFNDLVKVIEKYTMTNGNDMKDIFLFIFLGIFVIFILDLIFRIGQKLKS